MITFIIALLVLVGGYFLYGSYVERVFGPDKIRKTPALTMADGVDFIPLPTWKIFMIQFLNIAGLGPIFGAIMGAKFGTARTSEHRSMYSYVRLRSSMYSYVRLHRSMYSYYV